MKHIEKIKRLRTLRYLLSVALLLPLFSAPFAIAEDECRVQYSYWSSQGKYRTRYKTFDRGEEIQINRNGARHIKNLRTNRVRVTRSGIGSTVDLARDESDPGVAVYPPNVILQRVRCLEPGAGSVAPPIVQAGQDAAQIVASSFNNTIRAGLTTINRGMRTTRRWVQRAQQDAARSLDHWGSCPSAPAQQTYDRIKTERGNVQASLTQANQLKTQADNALASCRTQTNNDPICQTTYNSLAIQSKITVLTGYRNSLTTSLNAMRRMQCPTGCDQTLTIRKPGIDVRRQRPWNLENPIRVCSAGNSGRVDWDLTQLQRNPARVVRATAPRCTRWTDVSLCTDFDLRALLAELQRVRLVPPNVRSIRLDIPNRTMRMITGLKNADCREPLTVCNPAGSLKISVGKGEELFSGDGQCEDRITVACKNPPFGLELDYENRVIPDLKRARVLYVGTRGSVVVDLSAPNFQALCRRRDSLQIPRFPRIALNWQPLNLPFICTQPRLVDLIATP